MRKWTDVGVALSLLVACPPAANAEDAEAGFHGGSQRYDNGYFGTWLAKADNWYGVCGGDVPFVSGISVNEEGLWNNSALCSSYPISMFNIQSYVADPQPNPGNFSSKVFNVADCGDSGFVMGVAQPDGDHIAPNGTPVLCGQLPSTTYDCNVVEMPGGIDDLARDAGEEGAPDWSEYPSVTCGAGRYARAVAYRKYVIDHVWVATHSWAMGGLICCSL